MSDRKDQFYGKPYKELFWGEVVATSSSPCGVCGEPHQARRILGNSALAPQWNDPADGHAFRLSK